MIINFLIIIQMQNDIQPVHYLNENSTLRKDISDTFQRILKEDDKEETEILMKNQENVFVMNVNGDMFLMLEGLAYSRRYQNMRYLIQAY